MAATRKEQQLQSRVLPGPEMTFDLFGKPRPVRDESGPGKLPIGKYTKLSFQRVLTCLIRTSYEKITSVSNSELLSIRESESGPKSLTRQRIPVFPAATAPARVRLENESVFRLPERKITARIPVRDPSSVAAQKVLFFCHGTGTRPKLWVHRLFSKGVGTIFSVGCED